MARDDDNRGIGMKAVVERRPTSKPGATKVRPLRKILSSLALAATIFGCDGGSPPATCESGNGTQLNRCKGVRTEQVVSWKEASDQETKTTCYNAGGVFALTVPTHCADVAKFISVEGLVPDNAIPGLNVPGCNLYATMPGSGRIVIAASPDKLITIQMKARTESVDVTVSCNEPNAGCDMGFTMGKSQIAEIYFNERVVIKPDNILVSQVGTSPEWGISLNYITYTEKEGVPFFRVDFICLSKLVE